MKKHFRETSFAWALIGSALVASQFAACKGDDEGDIMAMPNAGGAIGKGGAGGRGNNAQVGTGGMGANSPMQNMGGSPPKIPPATGGMGAAAAAIVPPVGAARRLSRTEYVRTVRDLIAPMVPVSETRLPIDIYDPFDNFYRTQRPSQALVDATEALAEEITGWVVANPGVRDRVLGCGRTGVTPANDTACMQTFVQTFGRMALRRPLAPDEVTRFTALQKFSVEDNDYFVGAALALRAFLMHPEFLYRFEIGTPVQGMANVRRLNNYEMVTRLSYFLTGTTPDAALLTMAGNAAQPWTPMQVRMIAQMIMGRTTFSSNMGRFHAMWLGYERFANETGIVRELRDEANQLVGKSIQASPMDYGTLFTSTETFLTPSLAKHYGFKAMPPATGAWTKYEDADRGGIIGLGAFLAAGAKAGDSSITRRGKFIRAQVLCTEIPVPPEDGLADAPPKAKDPNACKKVRYEQHREDSKCAGCHALMDPIGFGIERYDVLGKFRTTDIDRADCPIDGLGEFAGIPNGNFSGPAQLGAIVLRAGTFESCLSQKVLSYALGRDVSRSDNPAALPRETPYVQMLERQFIDSKRDFREMLLTLVGQAAFALRQEEN